MPLLGYGSKAFTISLIENAIAVSNGRVTNDEINHIIALGKSLVADTGYATRRCSRHPASAS